jgi:murein DD-endopeptidase MepM/ murein hydrolase activator NlpD
MLKLSTPFKGFTHNDITQIYHAEHRALDIDGNAVNWGYGTALCAPEDVRILMVLADGYTPNSTKKLERGYGLWMEGLETGLVHQYWHTLPYLPVKKGDIVERGKIVAFMGNAGMVRQGGVYVPLEERTKKPYKGTHLHWPVFPQGYTPYQSKDLAIDPLPLIDFARQPTYSTFELYGATAKCLLKMSNVLAK